MISLILKRGVTCKVADHLSILRIFGENSNELATLMVGPVSYIKQYRHIMKPFSLVRATVITSFFAVSLSTASLIVQVYPYSLKESMNWISNFSKEYEENKPKFLAGINEIRNSHNMQDYVTIGGLLSKFLKDVHKLNATLVKGKIPDIDVSDDVDVTIRTLIDFIAAIKDMLDELLVRIKEWERNAKKVNEDTVILAVPGLPRWFKKYDLRISEMRCIGILDLKTLIENIVGANRPLEKLLSFFGTYIIEYQPIDLGQQLAWLRALSSFTDGMKYLGIYLKGDDEVSKASATEIMDALTWLGEDNQPLRNLIGNGEPGTLHSPMTKLYQRAHFIVKHLPKYWEILQVMSSTIQDELTKFEADLRSFSSIEMQRLFVEHGFVEGNTTYEAMALADKVKALIDDNGPITGLCLEVANYIKKGKPKNVETVASTAGNPAGTSAEAPAGTPAEAPTRTSAGNPTRTSAGNPTRTSAGNPARTSAEAPAGTPAGTPAEAPATSTTIATYTEYPKYFREYTAEEPNDSDSNLEDNTAPHETSSYKESEEGNGEPLINTNAEDASIPPASTREKTPASDVHKKAPSKALTLKKGSCRKATSWLSHLSLGAIPIVCVLLFI